MKVQYKGPNNAQTDLTEGKVYEVLKTATVNIVEGLQGEWYVLVDDSGEDYAYPPHIFDIVEE